MLVSDAVPGMQTFVGFRILVPGVVNKFLNLFGIARVNIKDFIEVAVDDGAARNLDRLVRIVVRDFREVAVRHHVDAGEPLAVLEPIRVEGCNGLDVRNIDVRDDINGVLGDLTHIVQRHFVHHRALSARIVDVDRAGDAAHEIVRMRVLAAQNGMNAHDFTLEVEHFKVVRDRKQIHGRRKLHGGMAPIALIENRELSRFNELLHAVLHIAEVTDSCERMVRRNLLLNRRRFAGIGIERADNVHPVERGELIEVNDMVLNVERGIQDVADQIGVLRDLDADCILNGANGGKRVNTRTDAADAFNERPGVAGIAALQNDFEAAPHRAGAHGVDNLAVIAQHCLHAQVTFNAGDRVDYDSAFAHYSLPPISLLVLARA